MNKDFIKAMLIRAVRTMAQAAVAEIGVDAAMGVLDVAWIKVASVAVLAGIVSMLTSIATGLPEV